MNSARKWRWTAHTFPWGIEGGIVDEGSSESPVKSTLSWDCCFSFFTAAVLEDEDDDDDDDEEEEEEDEEEEDFVFSPDMGGSGTPQMPMLTA